MLVLVAADVASTVLHVGQARAPVTSRVSAFLWRGVRALRGRGLSHSRVETLGIVIIVGW